MSKPQPRWWPLFGQHVTQGMLQSFTTQCCRQWRGIFSGCIMCGLDALFIFFFQFSATEWTVTTRALAVSNSLACIHTLILVHQQECMVGHCNAWTVSYCTLMDYATVSYWYICMSLTTSGECEAISIYPFQGFTCPWAG